VLQIQSGKGGELIFFPKEGEKRSRPSAERDKLRLRKKKKINLRSSEQNGRLLHRALFRNLSLPRLKEEKKKRRSSFHQSQKKRERGKASEGSARERCASHLPIRERKRESLSVEGVGSGTERAVKKRSPASTRKRERTISLLTPAKKERGGGRP